MFLPAASESFYCFNAFSSSSVTGEVCIICLSWAAGKTSTWLDLEKQHYLCNPIYARMTFCYLLYVRDVALLPYEVKML